MWVDKSKMAFKSLLCCLGVLLFIGVLPSILRSEDPLENAKKQWNSQKTQTQEQWQREKSQTEKAWDDLEKSETAKWERLKAEVERKWQTFVHSTQKQWVDYSREKDTRSNVDYEIGTIRGEALVREGDSRAMKEAQEKIEERLSSALSRKDFDSRTILESQIVDSRGRKITPGNAREYLKEEVLPGIKPDPTPFQGKDGIVRRRYSVEISMVPTHIRIRAEKYLPFVEENARRFRLRPQLILAIIHTESSFNPEAVSPCHAIGLMQIVPRQAGRDAYRFVYGEDKVITHSYLYDPRKNIELGSAYLHLLIFQHFADVPGEVRNRYVSICGYNWGPGSVRSKIVNVHPINRMSDEEVYMLLRQKTPEETRDYIKRVRERMPIYDVYFERG